jgi:hypothetical protein
VDVNAKKKGIMKLLSVSIGGSRTSRFLLVATSLALLGMGVLLKTQVDRASQINDEITDLLARPYAPRIAPVATNHSPAVLSQIHHAHGPEQQSTL